LRERGVEFEEREMGKNPLSAAELGALIGERDHLAFLNTRNVEYRDRGLKANPPSRSRAIELMAATTNLIRRPLLTDGDRLLIGFREAEYADFLDG